MKIEIEGFPPLPNGQEIERLKLGKPNVGDWSLFGNEWYETTFVHENMEPEIIAIPKAPPKPWYPQSWHDADGNLLPDVHEHDVKANNGWPVHCAPNDAVDVVVETERENKHAYSNISAAYAFNWRRVVAYRVILRAEKL